MSKTSYRPGIRDRRWIYKRGADGDVEVWAETADEAARHLRQHGFLDVNPAKLYPGRTSHIVPTSLDFEKGVKS